MDRCILWAGASYRPGNRYIPGNSRHYIVLANCSTQQDRHITAHLPQATSITALYSETDIVLHHESTVCSKIYHSPNFNVSTVHPAVYINVDYTLISHTAKRLFLTYRLKITWLHVSACLYTPSSCLQTYRLTASCNVPNGIPCTVLIGNI
jgi:hypothetical protein